MSEFLRPPQRFETGQNPEMGQTNPFNNTICKLAFPPAERQHMVLNKLGKKVLYNYDTVPSCAYYIAREPYIIDPTTGMIGYDHYMPGYAFVSDGEGPEALKHEMEAYLHMGVRNQIGYAPEKYAKDVGKRQYLKLAGKQVGIDVTAPESFIYNPETGLMMPPPVVMVVRRYGSPIRKVFGFDGSGNLFMQQAKLDIDQLAAGADIVQATAMDKFKFV